MEGSPATAAHTSHSAALEKHLKDVVLVHSSHAARHATLVYLFQIHSLVVLLFFLRVT